VVRPIYKTSTAPVKYTIEAVFSVRLKFSNNYAIYETLLEISVCVLPNPQGNEYFPYVFSKKPTGKWNTHLEILFAISEILSSHVISMYCICIWKGLQVN
jgi:hypothetical protein